MLSKRDFLLEYKNLLFSVATLPIFYYAFNFFIFSGNVNSTFMFEAYFCGADAWKLATIEIAKTNEKVSIKSNKCIEAFYLLRFKIDRNKNGAI